MNYCSVKLVIWMTAVVFKTHAQVVTLYSQLGASVTLPRTKWGGSRVTMHWTIQMKEEYHNVYTRTSMGQPLLGSNMRGRVSLDKTDYSLVIKNLQPEDFTTFKCELTENKNTVKSEYRLYQITVTASLSIILASQTLSLKCAVERSAVSTEIEWSTPQGKKAEGPRFSAQDSDLRVTNVTAQDHGGWICTVTYKSKKAVANVSVTVVDLSPPSQPLYTFLGSTSPLLLPCALHTRLDYASLSLVGLKGGHWSFTPFQGDITPEEPTAPQKFLLFSQGPQLYWKTPQGQKINGSILETDHCNLSIVKKVAEEGGGAYTCALDFSDRVTLSRTVRVEVLRVVLSQENPVLEGLALNLTCTLGQSSLDKLTVKWIVPRFSSINPLPSPPHSPILSIPRVLEKERGRWSCQLMKGDKILVTASLNLKTERVPVDVWLVVSICGAAVVLILVLVLVFICVRRYRQQRMFVRRRRKYCQCKHPQVKGFYKS